jgi:diguanylate cyclase (GGDEF)-like protein
VAQDPEHLRILRELGFQSAMIVPLRARGQTIGDLALVSAESGRRYDQDDLAMAADLAGRCGLALDNARLHKEALERSADLQHQALHDALTRLPNRTLFLDRLGQALARSDRRAGGPALLFVDLDGFKAVNDTHGHATGDELLAQVATRLSHAVRPEDTVSRFGGDEFTILCEAVTSRRDAVKVAKRVLACLEKPFAIGGQGLSIAASIGIVFARGCDETPESLIREGDAAMYRAKQQGPGHYQVFEQHTPLKALDRMTTERALRISVEGEGFGVAYQPIVDLRTSTVVGVEALSRWDHPKRGLLEARDFLPLAEETGLGLSVGALTLDRACRQGARWSAENLDAPPLVVFVNVSVEVLEQPDFLDLVEQALCHSGIDPATLCLEIKDSTFLNRSRSPIGSLLTLKGLGLRLAIDDFG